MINVGGAGAEPFDDVALNVVHCHGSAEHPVINPVTQT